MSAAEKLKRLIREEVRRAVKEEMSRVLNENSYSDWEDNIDFGASLEKQVKSKKTTQSSKKVTQLFDSRNPFASMLNETALSFNSEDARGFGYSADPSNRYNVSSGDFGKVGTVNSMLSSAKSMGSVEHTEIDVVPDYTKLMKSLKDKGAI